MKKIKSFTLAEVLITLVVIGIIAAITVPVVMANHKKTETAAKLKKFYSTFSNAVRLAEIEQGVPSYEWDFRNAGYTAFFETYLQKYFSYTSAGLISGEEFQAGQPRGLYTVYLNDGTIIGFDNNSPSIDNSIPASIDVYVDINGEKNPNILGRDIFHFNINNSGKIKNHNVEPFSSVDCYECTREDVISECETGGYACSQLIQMDGWEIKDDYPLKL